MSVSVLLDTSYLISLVNARRPRHNTAADYYRHLVKHDVPMYFSAIVAAEFGIKQPITELPLDYFRVLDFNLKHGQQAANLWNMLGPRDAAASRMVARDDVKLLAQASEESVNFILTEDAATLHKYCERLRAAGALQTRTILLSDGFDAGTLSEGGQLDWVGDPAAPSTTDS